MSTHISSLTFKTASPAPYLRALAHVGSHDSVYVGSLRLHIRVHFLLSSFSQIIFLFNDIWQAGCRFMSILHQSGSNCSLERSNDLLALFPGWPTVEIFPLFPRVFYFRTIKPSVSLETLFPKHTSGNLSGCGHTTEAGGTWAQSGVPQLRPPVGESFSFLSNDRNEMKGWYGITQSISE